MIQKKLQSLSRIINDITQIPLFSEMPLAEISSLSNPVTNEDSLRARVADICNLIDRLNKKDIDRFLGMTTTGSRECLTLFLKRLLPKDHNAIDNKIDYPLGMILLLRGFLTHRKNRGIKKALDFFKLTSPIDNYTATWEKILFRFNEVLDQILELLTVNGSKTDYKQAEIDEQLRFFLEEKLLRRYRRFFEDETIKKILMFIMAEGPVIDRDLSQSFNLDISQVRKLLFPLIPNVLTVSYHDSEFTKIELQDHVLEILKEVYFNRRV